MSASPELPTGTVTFLFTDIERSTQLLQALGEGYGKLLDDHNRLLREVFAAHGGVEVSTEGDAFFVVFTSPSDATMAVAAAQRALLDYAAEAGVELRVRMGLHTGEGTLLGDNYGGIDVNRAARISSAAHGGQILLSEAARVLAESSLGPGVRVKDLGEHHLKDIERPEHLYQLCVDGLPADFPAPRTLRSRPNNLPVALTTFVTRERELKEIVALLKQNRLVTLTGPGGTGKTRLGLEVAREILLDFEDGAFAVLLGPVRDADLVPSTIAKSLGILEHGMTPIAETVKEHLAGKHMLLLLDNFEQVAAAASFVAELLAVGARIAVVVTSRVALRISGEQEYPVPPMTLPDPDRLPPLDALGDYEAMSLFVQRARSVQPNFEITERNARAVTQICWRLDGLPLAIELAAARIRLLSPEEMVERLTSGLGLLSGGARDLPARQQTLRNAIAWSYDLLEEPLQVLFRRLAVLVGTWTFESVDAICNPGAELGLETLDALDALTESNLIRRFETDQGETRFRMLQTISEYCLELFDASGEAEELKRRHAEFFLAFAEEWSPRLTSDSDSGRIMELEHDNFRAVLRWAHDRADQECGLRLGAALWRFWMLRSHLAEGRRVLTELIQLPGAAGKTALRARALLALGSVTYWQNDFGPTRSHYLEALEIFRAVGDDAGTAEALYDAGFLSLIERDPGGARPYYEESRRIATELGDELTVANTTWGLGMCAVQDRDWEEAKRLGAEALERYTALGDWFGVSLGQFIFFQVARLTGDEAGAYSLLTVWLDAMEDIGSKLATFEFLASMESDGGQHESAVRLTGAARALKEEYGGGAPPPLIDIDDPLPAARAALGEARVAELMTEGRELSLDEAAAYGRKLIENQVGLPAD